MKRLKFVVAAMFAVLATGSAVAAVAFDSAADPVYDGLFSTSFHNRNGGFGWRPWFTLPAPNSPSGGTSIRTSSSNGTFPGLPNIDTAGRAFRLFGQVGTGSIADRQLLTPMALGLTLNIDLDFGAPTSTQGASQDFRIYSSTGGSMFEVHCDIAHSGVYYRDAAGDHALGFGSEGAFRISLTQSSASTYTGRISRLGSGAFVNTAGNLMASGLVGGIALQSDNGLFLSDEFFANTMEVVPEPGAMVACVVGLAAFGRRKLRS